MFNNTETHISYKSFKIYNLYVCKIPRVADKNATLTKLLRHKLPIILSTGGGDARYRAKNFRDTNKTEFDNITFTCFFLFRYVFKLFLCWELNWIEKDGGQRLFKDASGCHIMTHVWLRNTARIEGTEGSVIGVNRKTKNRLNICDAPT